MRVWTGVALLIAWLVWGGVAPGWAQSSITAKYPGKAWDSVRAEVQQTLRNRKIKGMSIAVVDDQQIVWAEGFGTADVFFRNKATAETVYAAGVLSKLLTATAVMRLDEQNKLGIDRPLSRYLPQFAIKSRFGNQEITVRSVLCHHSGLPSDWLQGTWSLKPTPYTDYARLLHDEYTAAPPNTIYSYSNIGYGLLAHMVQQVSGQRFDDYMEDAVLRPLGMRTATFRPVGDEFPANYAKVYDDGYEQDVLPLGDAPVDSLRASVLDMSRLMMMVLAKGRVGGAAFLKPETVAEMLRPQGLTGLDADVRTGLGWFREGAMASLAGYDGPLYGCGGATMTNHYAALLVLPREELGIVVLCNSTEVNESLPVLMRETARAALRAKTGKSWSAIRAPAFSKAVTLSPQALQRYTGYFATDYFSLVKITEQGGKLHASLGKISLSLTPRADGAFTVNPPRILGLFPVSIGAFRDLSFRVVTLNGRRMLVQYHEGRGQPAGEQVKPVPISAAWRARTGVYAISNATADAMKTMTMTLAIEDGFLVARASGRATLPLSVALNPMNNTEATIMGSGRFKGETIRVETQRGEEVLCYSGFVFKKR
ncbi:MAG TPA: serine hydrolase domain-containing protein [Armatimonadota bacterium]|nr:serine hydrolase domain-containing protein [Armatimonadota bacterium]